MKIKPTLLRGFLLLTALLAWPPVMQAQYTLATNNGAITITHYTGTGGAVIIPAMTNGFPVVAIGPDAFEGNDNVKSVTIPGSVTNIGDYAFSGCEFITNAIIPGSLIGEGQSVFEGCGILRSITLGNGIPAINTNMFDECGFTSVIIPNSVTSIGPMAFSSCTYLTNIVISSSMTSIGADAFAECYHLQQVYFLGNAPTAGPGAFSNDSDTTPTIYYLPLTTGWTNTFAGCPTELWTPPLPALGITTYSNQPVVIFPYLAESIGTNCEVQMTTNLGSGNWVTVTNGVVFIAVQITNAPGTTFFRLAE